jgi:ABC-2 type transport system permease protein
MAFLAMLAAGYALQVMTKMLREEKNGRGEILLVQSVPRPRWMLDYLLISCVGSFMLLVISGIGAGALYGYYTDSADGAWKVFFAAIAQTPAVWVFIGLAALLMGLWPKALSLVWLVYTAFTLIGLIGPLLQLPEWVSDISPYAQIPGVPAEEWTAWSTVILLAVFAVFTVVGMFTIRKRDLII